MFGYIVTGANWKNNIVVLSHPSLQNEETKRLFLAKVNIIAILVIYCKLKQAMLMTLQHGFTPEGPPRPKKAKTRVAGKLILSLINDLV